MCWVRKILVLKNNLPTVLICFSPQPFRRSRGPEAENETSNKEVSPAWSSAPPPGSRGEDRSCAGGRARLVYHQSHVPQSVLSCTDPNYSTPLRAPRAGKDATLPHGMGTTLLRERGRA